MPLQTNLVLSPAEAASGTTRDVRVPGGGDRTVAVLFPPVRGGAVLQVNGPDGPFLIQVMVASSFLNKPPVTTGEGIPAVLVSSPAPTRPTRGGGGRGGKLGAQLAVVAVAIGLMIAFAVSQTSHKADSAGSGGDSSIIMIGSCLSGTLPRTTTAQSVSGVNAVSCSSADAHYKVVNSFVGATDMTKCQSDRQAQYAFTETTTVNGNSSVVLFCVEGLGSYSH